jgi:hypothetical protein
MIVSEAGEETATVSGGGVVCAPTLVAMKTVSRTVKLRDGMRLAKIPSERQ